MNRRGLTLGAAAGVCTLLVATLGAGSSATKVLRTTDGPVVHALEPDPTTDVTPRAAENLPRPFGAGPSGQAAGAGSGAAAAGGAGAGGTGGGAQAEHPSSTTTPHRHVAAPATQAAAPPAPAPGVHGPLRTVGNRIVDADGQPVVLRGIQRVGFQIPGKWPPITDAEMAHARDWGANAVRLPMGEAYFDRRCTNQYVPDYLETLDGVVQSITSRGMVALLDLSFVTRTPCGDSFRWKMADTGSIPFWLTIAQRYKDNPLVVFDLFNEPHGIDNGVWRDGGDVQDPGVVGSIRWTAVGMQQLYDAVRSTGATNVVTITGNGYGGSPVPILDGHQVDGYNIVYATHVYTCSEADPYQLCTSNPANQHPTIDPRWGAVAARYPVMITEFGWPNKDDGTYNERVVRFAQSQNPPWGWVAFGWSGRANSEFGLVANLKTYAPTAAGAPVQAALASPP